MAYKIRYGPEEKARKSSFFLRLAASVGFLTGAVLVSLLRPEQRAILAGLLKEAPVTALEQATAACAAAVAEGKGWHHGLTVFAAMLLS